MADSRTLSGRIVHLNRTGVGYLVTADKDEKDYVFTFDKIRRKVAHGVVPYRGESAAAMGLREGMNVEFEEVDGIVDTLNL